MGGIIIKKILIVEDDNNINHMLQEVLTETGYACTSAYSGTEALLRIENETYDLVILDLMLPGMSGQDVLTEARKHTNIPFIILSAKDELDSKVDMLTLGANDYMTKPFEPKELEARILVQLRSPGQASGENISLSHRNLELDLAKKSLLVDGQPVTLTARELKIMELFLQNPGRVFSKNEIYEYAWDEYYIGEDKTINVHISNIRQKLKKHTDIEYIETVWGIGYRLKK